MNNRVVNLSFIVLFVGLMITGMGQSVLFSILAPVARTIGFIDSGVGIIISCSAAVLVVFCLLWGRVIDRINIKYAFMCGLVSFGIGSLAFAYVLEIGLDGSILPSTVLILLIIVRVIYAALIAGAQPSAMAYITKTTNEKQRVSAVALMSSAFSIGLAVGPSIVLISEYGNVLTPIYFTSYLAVFVTVIAGFALKDYAAPANVKSEIISDTNPIKFWDGKIFPTLMSLAFVNTIFSCLQQSAGFMVQDLFTVTGSEASRRTGIVLSTFAGAMIFTQLVLIQKLKIDYKTMILAGYFLAGVGLTSTVFSSIYASFVFIIVSTAISGVGIGYLIPSIQTQITFFASTEEQGKIAGYIFSFSALGFIVGPLLGTGLIGFGVWMPYLVSVVMLILSATCMLLGKQHKKNEALASG